MPEPGRVGISEENHRSEEAAAVGFTTNPIVENLRAEYDAHKCADLDFSAMCSSDQEFVHWMGHRRSKF